MFQRTMLPSSSESSGPRNILTTHLAAHHIPVDVSLQWHYGENLGSRSLVFMSPYLFYRNKNIWSTVDTATPTLDIKLQQLPRLSMQAITLRVTPHTRYRGRRDPVVPGQRPQLRVMHWVLESNTMQCCQVRTLECCVQWEKHSNVRSDHFGHMLSY